MTLQEASGKFHLNMDILLICEKNGLLKGRNMKDGTVDYQEGDLRQAFQFYFLSKAGMAPDTVKYFAALQMSEEDTSAEEIRLLRKCRFQLLEEIHEKQQMLDQLDYLAYEIKNRQRKQQEE